MLHLTASTQVKPSDMSYFFFHRNIVVSCVSSHYYSICCGELLSIVHLNRCIPADIYISGIFLFPLWRSLDLIIIIAWA